MRKAVVAFVIWVAVVGGLPTAVFADFQAGLAAYQQGDFATALNKWRPLAAQGDADAQGMLGVLYFYGQGVPKDFGEAAKWNRMAAEQGNAKAQARLGAAYYFGNGVVQDYSRSLELYRMAAEQGQPEAQAVLGALYRVGQSVPQDYVLAHMWSNIAAANGALKAAENRQSVQLEMTPAQITEAQKLAREWMAKHGQ